MQDEVEPKQLRSFGMIVGGIFLIIGFWPVFFSDSSELRLWALITAGILTLPAIVWPIALKPIFRLWMKIGHVLGWVNTRIILAIGFYGIFVPVGLVMRMMGNDPMSRKLDPKAKSYRVMKAQRPASHMRQQF